MTDYSQFGKDRPASYHQQKCCLNCQHCFNAVDYDSSNGVYCTLNAPPRPLCGLGNLHESWPHSTLKEDGDPQSPRNLARKAWDDWSISREVRVDGVCDFHKIMAPTNDT